MSNIEPKTTFVDLWEDCLAPITLMQLAEWIEKNKHVTWHKSTWGGRLADQKGSKRGKYIRFNLDTRDMKIFALHLNGMGEDITIDFRDKGEGNLLDALDRILAEKPVDA